MSQAQPRHQQEHGGEDDHDRGLELDLPTLVSRRRLLALGGVGLGAGLLALAGCGSSGGPSTTSTSSTATASETCTVLPEETAGPYPGDGSNGPDVLGETGIVRSDITSSFGGASGVAEGAPLTVKLKVLDVAAGCAPKAGAAVYLWHADARGRYSLYSQGVTGENYLRGVQEVDADGWVTFTSIVPGCYDGRWPHIHFEVYDSLDDASKATDTVLTSQLAMPQDVCETVYADTARYPSSTSNLARVSLATDNVFRDGWTSQLATVTGDTTSGWVAHLDVAV